MAAPQGITPAVASATSVVIPNPGATAQEIHGMPANPAHGQWTWEEPEWYPWQVVPRLDGHVPDVSYELIGEVPSTTLAGHDPQSYADPTATLSHNAPWPKAVSPDAQWDSQVQAEQQLVNAEAHSIDSGDPASFTRWNPPTSRQLPWARMGYVTDGEGGMAQVPQQLQGLQNTGFRRGTGWFVDGEDANRFGLSSAHVSRYRAIGEIPWVPNSTQGAQRPLQIKPASRRSYPVGPGSPFEGQTPGYFGIEGMYGDYVGLPSDYQASPDPVTGPQLAQQQTEPSWGVDFLG